MPTVSADGTYWVDISADPTFTPGSFISIYPESLTFDDMISGVGNCAFQVSFSARDADDNPIVSHDWVGPYRTYYRLRYGNIVIQAGPIVSANTVKGTDFTSIAGKTWEHMLERWQYPFDGRPTHVNDYQYLNTFDGDELTGSGVVTPPGLVYQANNRDVIRIFGDLFSQTMNVPERIIFDITALATLSGITTNYQFTLADNTKLFQIVDDLSNIGQGFDWWISHDMKVLWASPYRFGNNAAPVISFTFDGSTEAATPDDLQFTNNGPTCTHITGSGAGFATSTQLAATYGEPASQLLYTRLDENYDFGDVRNRDELDAKTHKQFSIDLNPQHDIPMTVNPRRISGFWSTFRKGKAIYINYDLIAHMIDSAHQLVSYQATVSSERLAQVSFTLKQIYATAPGVGIPEG
jgi:hypothetical protein